MKLIVVWNKLLGLVSLAPSQGDLNAQKLAARYYFSNFWAEFSSDVLSEFQTSAKARAVAE